MGRSGDNIFYYGGDYNPDQWDEKTLQEDMRLFKKAGINMVTVPVFSWAKLQPTEDTYDFEWLDKIIEMLYENEIYVCLATSTAAQPAWMSKKYPEILPVDFHGRKLKHGARANFCPTNPIYRRFSRKLARKLAERYGEHPAIKLWHINNEYRTYCYCDHCENEFRLWLEKKYKTLENLNRSWYTDFWGHTIYEWDEIFAPSELNEMWMEEGRECTCFQAISIDYNRFMSDAILNCYKGEYEELKRITPGIPITTNFMGAFKPLDYFEWANYMDVISWDNYPRLDAPMYKSAMRHDLMRSLKSGQSFLLMEQTPSQQNWQLYNSLKKPGVLRLQSYQAISRGADGILYFQLRQSRGACEKFHGALISHEGSENTRVFQECAQLGEELEKLSELKEARVPARVGIIFDWENWWALELSSGPSVDLKYIDQMEKYYKPFYEQNIPVDFLSPEMDLGGYDLILAPALYMLKAKCVERIKDFVKAGGTFLTTYFSGIVNENDLAILGGFPGNMRDLLGIWVEETDALLPGQENHMIPVEKVRTDKNEYVCGLLCDVIHLRGAEALFNYGQDFYAGQPVVTVNRSFGKGSAYYIGSQPEEDFLMEFMEMLLDEVGVKPLMNVPDGVELVGRQKNDRTYLFLMNHEAEKKIISFGEQNYREILSGQLLSGENEMEGRDVWILVES